MAETPSLFDRLAVAETPPVAAEPVTVVIFGGADDLAHRKLLPALYNLHLDGLLQPRTSIVGVGRKEFDDTIAEVFNEHQIYRIDHYLGKETVQNLLVLRFANSIFEPLFNQKYIDHVQITVAEAEGVGTRANYYEQAGALRDMVQNHMLQLLSMIAMEPPHSLESDVVRDEKLEVLQSLRPIAGDRVDAQVVRGQYAAGFDLGKPVSGYPQEPAVRPTSTTETYVE